jgi:hypothetical protein
MELEEKIRILAERKAFGIRKLLSIGNSYAIVIPKFWVEYNCLEIDGDYFMQLDVEGESIRFSPINVDSLKAVKVKEKS